MKSMHKTKGLDIGGDGSRLPETPVQEPADPRVRNFRITQEILQTNWYTAGCIRCKARLSGMDHRNHTAACRARSEKKMTEDEDLKQTIQKHGTRRMTKIVM